jgi:hypothetical protein
MAINPAIALGVQPSQPLDMLGAYGKAMSIKNLVDGARLQQQQGAALSQKMQFDSQDQALDLASKKIGVRQKLASGLIALPPEQRAAQYPFFRQQYVDLTGDNNIPGEYDEGLVMQTALLGQNPDKMQEVIRAEAQRLRFAALQREQVGGASGAQSAPAQEQDGAGVAMNADGTANLTAPPVNVRGMVNPATESSTYGTLLRSIMRDPQLAGTPYEQNVRDAYLKIKTEEEVSPGRGVELRSRPDGGVQRFRYGEQEGSAMPMGRDPNAEFWMGEDGTLIPNQALLDARQARAKAGATNLAVYPPGAIEPSKGTRADIEKEAMQSSSSIQRMSQIQQGFKPEYLQFAPRLSAGWAALKEKGGGSLSPGDQRFLQDFSAWSRGAIEEVNTYIQQKTGAAMGVQESQRLMKGVPNPGQGLFDGDSPTQFKAKLDDTIKQLKLVEARSLYALRNGLSLMGANGEPVVPLSAMPKIMDERGLQIEQQVRRQFPNLNAKELKQMVVKQLGVEFGIGSD